MSKLDALDKISETNGEKLEFINKRIDILQKNITRLKILSPLYDGEVPGGRESDVYSHIINKAIEYFYKSDDVKKRLSEV